MKLVYTEGCTVTGLSIGGESPEDMTLDEVKDAFRGMTDKIIETSKTKEDKDKLVQAMMDLLQSHGKYKYLYHCEQCGDSVVEYTMSIKKNSRT